MNDPILHRDGDRFYWDRPLTPDQWDQSRKGTVPVIRTKFRISYDQKCELILYRRIYSRFDKGINSVVRENLEEIQQTGRWRVKSLRLHPKRIGLVEFSNLQLSTFADLWRKPINPRENFAMVRGDISSVWSSPTALWRQPHPLSLSIGEHYRIEPFVQWPGIFELDRPDSANKYFCKVKDEFRQWLCHRTKGNLFLFSDSESTFEDSEDEWIYLTDYGLDGA